MPMAQVVHGARTRSDKIWESRGQVKDQGHSHTMLKIDLEARQRQLSDPPWVEEVF